MTFWDCVSAHPWFATAWFVIGAAFTHDVAALAFNAHRNAIVARLRTATARTKETP